MIRQSVIFRRQIDGELPKFAASLFLHLSSAWQRDLILQLSNHEGRTFQHPTNEEEQKQ
jgi:hypothetical protein